MKAQGEMYENKQDIEVSSSRGIPPFDSEVADNAEYMHELRNVSLTIRERQQYLDYFGDREFWLSICGSESSSIIDLDLIPMLQNENISDEVLIETARRVNYCIDNNIFHSRPDLYLGYFFAHVFFPDNRTDELADIFGRLILNEGSQSFVRLLSVNRDDEDPQNISLKRTSFLDCVKRSLNLYLNREFTISNNLAFLDFELMFRYLDIFDHERLAKSFEGICDKSKDITIKNPEVRAIISDIELQIYRSYIKGNTCKDIRISQRAINGIFKKTVDSILILAEPEQYQIVNDFFTNILNSLKYQLLSKNFTDAEVYSAFDLIEQYTVLQRSILSFNDQTSDEELFHLLRFLENHFRLFTGTLFHGENGHTQQELSPIRMYVERNKNHITTNMLYDEGLTRAIGTRSSEKVSLPKQATSSMPTLENALVSALREAQIPIIGNLSDFLGSEELTKLLPEAFNPLDLDHIARLEKAAYRLYMKLNGHFFTEDIDLNLGDKFVELFKKQYIKMASPSAFSS